jgi:ligand-binding SRPBCC domain-containing protein
MITFGKKDGHFTLATEQWLPRPLAEVFAFFADAGTLDALTPSWVRFEILTPRPIAMKIGTLIDYRLRLRGPPIRRQSEISNWSPPHRFVDEQRRGPYRLWHHTHAFAERDNGTVVRDLVRYAVPGGTLANSMFVRRDLQKIFAYRQQKLAELFP